MGQVFDKVHYFGFVQTFSLAEGMFTYFKFVFNVPGVTSLKN